VIHMKTMDKGIKVILADDHQILLDGLQQLLEKAFDVVACAGDGNELVVFTQRHKPDVIITDINMPRLSGIEAVKRIRAGGLATAVIFLTVLDDAKLVLRAFQVAGDVAGYVLKSSAGSELVIAIQEVLAGRSYITPRITSGVLHECMQRVEQLPEGLTSRQTEVLRLIADGKTMKEVASVLDISTRTAEAHKYQMMHELGIRTCAQLVQFAVREGLVTLPGSSNGNGNGSEKSQRSFSR
jgi:DNA-binding NarL/FixJ family response regulator